MKRPIDKFRWREVMEGEIEPEPKSDENVSEVSVPGLLSWAYGQDNAFTWLVTLNTGFFR